MSPLRAITLATLSVGVLDGLEAIIFFGLRGATSTRIFEAIAAGILGRQAAVQGGLQTALLGVGLPTANSSGRRGLVRRPGGDRWKSCSA